MTNQKVTTKEIIETMTLHAFPFLDVRSLITKRKELSELKESVKHLKSEVHTKRKNILTLEDLLKSAGTSTEKPRSRKQSSRHSNQAVNNHFIESTSAARPAIIKFHISGPDGLCIEFNERGDTMVMELIKHVDDVFSTEHIPGSEAGTTKLTYQGRLLMDSATVDDCCIRPGDTVVAVMKKNTGEAKETFKEPTDPVTTAQSQNVNPNVVAELSTFLARQQDTTKEIAQEMRCV